MTITNETQTLLSNIILKVVPYLNEKQKRLFLGTIASELGHGGVTFVNSVSGAARQTIINGAAEAGLEPATDEPDDQKKPERMRKPGAGRKTLTEKYPDLHDKIQSLIGRHGAFAKLQNNYLPALDTTSISLPSARNLTPWVIAGNRTRKCAR